MQVTVITLIAVFLGFIGTWLVFRKVGVKTLNTLSMDWIVDRAMESHESGEAVAKSGFLVNTLVDHSVIVIECVHLERDNRKFYIRVRYQNGVLGKPVVSCSLRKDYSLNEKRVMRKISPKHLRVMENFLPN